jgi:hypothetical protein
MLAPARSKASPRRRARRWPRAWCAARRSACWRLADLEHRLKLRVALDETGALHDGIELHYALEPHRTIRPTFVRVGPAALIDDVLVHRNMIERVTATNGAMGKLRQPWDRAHHGRACTLGQVHVSLVALA